jgi:phosphatidyl-myo-inositol dimannoside synthase
MKKILLFTRNFPPLKGGMERLNYNIYLELSRAFNVLVVGPKGSYKFLAESTKYREFSHKPLLLFLWSSFMQSLSFCKSEKPDLIIAGSGATALSARIIGYLFNIKVVAFLHGLDLVVENLFYQMLFLPSIRACDGVFVNSDNTGKLAITRKIDLDKIKIIYPGVKLPKETLIDSNDFKENLGISDKSKILLSVGRLTERKGLFEFVQKSLPYILQADPDFVLVIVGDEPNNALHHKLGVKEKISQVVKKKELENNVIFLGYVNEAQLAEAYKNSYLHIFPGIELSGDVEGFGMVAIEAAAYGLPTIAFAVGGIPEAVSHGESGWLITPGDYAAMTETILNSNLHDNQVNADKCKKHAQKFTWQIFGERLRLLCQEIIAKE